MADYYGVDEAGIWDTSTLYPSYSWKRPFQYFFESLDGKSIDRDNTTNRGITSNDCEIVEEDECEIQELFGAEEKEEGISDYYSGKMQQITENSKETLPNVSKSIEAESIIHTRKNSNPQRFSPTAFKNGNRNERRYHIGNDKYVTVSSFRGEKKVHIRQFYKSDKGHIIPTRKRLSLTIAEWKEMVNSISIINSELK